MLNMAGDSTGVTDSGAIRPSTTRTVRRSAVCCREESSLEFSVARISCIPDGADPVSVTVESGD